MRIDNPSISGSLSFIGGNNSISATSVNLTGSFSGSVVGTFEGAFSSTATANISGAFDSVSSSLASRVASQESFSSSLDNTFATDSDLNLVSSSVDSLNAATSSYLQNTTDTLTGDLTVTGTITAQEFHTEYVSASITFESGSHKFGDTLDDIHQFTGSLLVNGTGAGSVGTVNIKGSNPHLGFTSGSGTFRSWVGHFDTLGHGSEADLNIKTGYGTTGNIRFTADGDTTAAQMYLQGSSGHLGIGTTDPGSRRLSVHKNTAITAGFNDISEFLDTTLGVGGSVSLNVGRENATRNLGKMAFKYAGDNSTSNALNFGFYDADNLMTILANGSVGIGTTSPSGDLEISGSGNSNRTITFNPSFNDDISISSMGVDANNKNAVTIGQANSQNNSGVFRFHYAGAGSTNNYVGLGFYANDDKLVIRANGNVGIGTDSPDRQLEIYGTNDGYLKLDGGRSGNHGYTLGSDTYGFVIYDDTLSSYRFVVDQDTGYVGINETSPSYPLDVQGQIANRKGLLSAYGVYTVGGTYTNQWQKVFEISYPNVFAYAGMKLLVTLAGDTSNVNMNAEVHINYKFQSNNGRININIVNFGELPLTTDDFEVYRDGTNTKLVFYHRVTRNYARPYYTLLNNSDSSMTWSNTVVGASLSGETDDGFTEKNIVNTINALAHTGNVGIGTTSPTATFTVGHGSHGVGTAYLGASSLPSIAGLFTDSNTNGGTGYGDLHIKSRSDYGGYYNTFFHTAATNNTPQIRMTIRPDGNIGIGTTSPRAALEVDNNSDTGGDALIVTTGANNGSEYTGIRWDIADGSLTYGAIRTYLEASGYGRLAFMAGDNAGNSLSEYMCIAGEGKVGIGTTQPGARLTVSSTATGDTRNLLLTNLNDTDGDSASLGFSMLADNTYVKGGIMFERTLNAGRGNLYLLTNALTDGSNVSKSDARLTVQHDGKIGINTTQPSYQLEVNGHVQTGQVLNVSSYSHLGQTNSGAATILAHNARVDTSNNNRVTTTNTGYPSSFIKMYYTQGISFHTTPSTMTAGDIVMDGVGANSYERMRVTSDGITFNGDTAAVNALDDYEEGTWTPVLTASSSAPTVGYAYRSGDYTKIGNIVFCRFGFKVNSISGGSGTVRVSGLPYTHSSQGAYQEPNISVQAGALSTADYAYRTRMFVANSSTYIEGRIVNNSDTAWNISEITSTSWIIAEFFYHVN